VSAVALLAGDTSEGRVGVGELGQYLKRTDPAFSPKVFGYSGLVDMLRNFPELMLQQEGNTYWVSIKPVEVIEAPAKPARKRAAKSANGAAKPRTPRKRAKGNGSAE